MGAGSGSLQGCAGWWYLAVVDMFFWGGVKGVSPLAGVGGLGHHACTLKGNLCTVLN